MTELRQRRPLRPLRQGDLDGLCGVYAVINAMRALVPTMPMVAAEALFEELMNALRKHDDGRRPMTAAGITRRHLIELLARAIEFIERRYGVETKRRRPALPRRSQKSTAALWRALARSLSPACVAIIGLGGYRNHWSLVTAVSPRVMRLCDSDGMKLLRRSQCRAAIRMRNDAHHVITGRNIVLVERVARRGKLS